MRNQIILMGVVLSIVGMISGCSNSNGPDEFSVLKKPPLVVPPDYHLTPPGGDSSGNDAYTPQEIAKRALFGDTSN